MFTEFAVGLVSSKPSGRWQTPSYDLLRMGYTSKPSGRWQTIVLLAL